MTYPPPGYQPPPGQQPGFQQPAPHQQPAPRQQFQPWPQHVAAPGGMTGPGRLDTTFPFGPPVQPTMAPPEGRLSVQVNVVQAIAVAIICALASAGIFYWQWYEGSLFDFTTGDGRVTKGTIFFHLVPLALAVVVLVMVIKALDRKAKLIFEAPGVQFLDKTQPDGYRKVGWDQIGRVCARKVASGKSSTERWIVMDMSGSILVNLATSGLSPKPETGLGQVAAIARGRAYVD